MHEISPAELVGHAEFLRGLSRQLVHGPDLAEDAVQETWLAALEHPPRASGRLRAWCSRVLRNAARQDQRGERRRSRRERSAARPEPTESTVERVIRTETIQRVAVAVTRLEEPYRTTILLRHYTRLAPREIATRMQAPIDTVKSRLQRAYAQLRRTLDGEGGSCRAALLPLAGPEVLLAGPPPAGSPDRGSTRTVATWKVVAVAAALLAGGVVLWQATGSTRESQEPFLPVEAPDVLARHAHEDPGARPVLEAAGGGRRTPVEVELPSLQRPPTSESVPPLVAVGPPAAADGTPKTRRIEGRVTMKAGTFAGGTVWVLAEGGAPPASSGSDPGRGVPVSLDGTFRLDEARMGALVLRVTPVGLAPREVRVYVGEELEQHVQIVFGSGRVWGTVFDGAGQPAEGVTVRVTSHLRDGPNGLEPTAEGDPFSVAVRTDRQGRYDVRGLPPGSFVVVAEPASDLADPRNIRSIAISLADGEERWVDVGRVRADPRWSGVVRYADGAPVRGAGSVFLADEKGESRLYVAFDGDGRFSQDVPPGLYRMEFVLTRDAPGLAGPPLPRLQRVPTDARIRIVDRELVADVTLPGVRVAGRVEGLEPRVPPPRRGAQLVTLILVEAKQPQAVPLIAGTVDPAYVATVSADGAFFLDGLPPGIYKVGGSPRAIRARAGADSTVEIPGGPASVELSLVFGSE